MNLSVPGKLPIATPAKFAATIMGGKPEAGVLAVAFQLTDPTGQVCPVSGVRPALKGTAVLEWTPATNDPTGAWALTATELVTGRSVKRTFQVTK